MQPRHQLAALIQSVEEANGWSDPEVAERARERGHTISKSNISRLRLEPVRSVKGDAIKALAAGLGISPLDVADAALASMGIQRSRNAGDDVEAAIRRDPVLAETQRRMLLALLREMKGTSDEDQDTQDPQSDPPTHGEARTGGAPMKLAAVPDNGGEVDEPLPYVSAARDIDGPTDGELRRRPGADAGEENQDPGDDWGGA